MAKNKILTIEDLIKFCRSNKVYNFSSQETGKPIVVQSIQDFSSADVEESEDGKLYCKVRVCHTLLNRNKSFISEESMTKAMPTLKYSPLLAMIHQLDDGTWDFHSHDIHVEVDEDGNEYTVYDEHQIGTFTADEPYLEYDEEMDKTYVVARVVIPEEYTRAADIVRSKKGTKVSCELIVYDCSYNAKEKYLQLDNFRFNGCTCLGSEKDGTPIGEGMLGSKLTLEDFSEDNNSLVKFSKQLIEMQAKLDELEARFNINNISEEGGTIEVAKIKENFEEVTETVEVTETEETTEEEVTVTENESEETVDETSEEVIVEEAQEETVEEAEAETEVTEEVVEEEPTETVVENEVENTVEYSFTINGETKKFAVSLQEKIYAIQDLVNATYAEVDNTYYGVYVYDDYVIMCDYWSGRYYKQSYTSLENDSYALTGDRIEVYTEFVTADEQKELEDMRSNYSSVVEELNTYKSAEIFADKMSVFDDEGYANYLDTDEFKALMSEEFVNKYSKEELSEKADAALGKLTKKNKTFAFAEAKPKKRINRVAFNSEKETEETYKPYGDLFDE